MQFTCIFFYFFPLPLKLWHRMVVHWWCRTLHRCIEISEKKNGIKEKDGIKYERNKEKRVPIDLVKHHGVCASFTVLSIFQPFVPFLGHSSSFATWYFRFVRNPCFIKRSNMISSMRQSEFSGRKPAADPYVWLSRHRCCSWSVEMVFT